MAIQMRRGLMRDFDPYKMLPGEWAVSIDASTSNQIVWMCFSPGICKRMGTYEDFVAQIKEATEEVKTEYSEEFNTILNEVKTLSIQVSSDKNTVVSIKTDIQNTYLPQIQKALSDAQLKAESAKNSADAAAISEANAKTSEKNAKSSETAAKNSQTNASTSESNAKISETNAATSATTATAKATDAANYASNAETSALTATNKAIEASQYAEEAAESAKQSQISADAAAVSEMNAKTSEENAKTYAEQAKEVSAVEVMTEENNGIGKPDGDTITVDENGTFKAIKAEQDGNGKVISDTYILRESTLNTLEEIDANTSEENIAGALAIKSLKSNLTNSFDTLNSKLAITNYSKGTMDDELNSIDLEKGIYILLTYHGFALDYNGLFYVINTGYSEPSKVVPIYQSNFLANMIILSVDYDNNKLIANRTTGGGSLKYNLYKFISF